MSFLKLSRVTLTISSILVLAALVTLFTPGPQLSVEFTGGTQLELALPQDKAQPDLLHSLQSFQKDGAAMTEVSIARTKTGTYFTRIPTLTNEEHTALLAHLNKDLGKTEELQYTTIGPTVGESLKQHALLALLAASLAIITYLAFAFRKMPRNLSPWSFGIAAVIALLHDILLTVGIFTILSHTTTFQVDTLFVTALLSIMGHSVSDSIVIFDRIRDNLFISGQKEDFTTVAVRSLRQSFTRTMNMGVAVLIMLFSLFFFGSESIRWFILTLITGTIIGSYSSYFIAVPLVIFWRNRTMNKRK
jgi:preprotein translocase subunit SecF